MGEIAWQVIMSDQILTLSHSSRQGDETNILSGRFTVMEGQWFHWNSTLSDLISDIWICKFAFSHIITTNLAHNITSSHLSRKPEFIFSGDMPPCTQIENGKTKLFFSFCCRFWLLIIIKQVWLYHTLFANCIQLIVVGLDKLNQTN